MSKKKVAIVTTHRANNFGALLQALALVDAANKLGAEAVVLDWRSPHFEWLYHRAWRMHRNPVPAVRGTFYYLSKEREVRRKFNEFRNLLPLSKPIKRRSELEAIADDYAGFIVGSDQVWNPAVTAVRPQEFDRVFLLNFVNDSNKKCAYAASIGGDKIELELKEEFGSSWRSFKEITMREFEGSRFVGDCINREVKTVLDPVLLHDNVFWQKYMEPYGVCEKEYILLYNIWGCNKLEQAAARFADENSMILYDVLVPGQRNQRGDNKIKIGPAEFLWLIGRASKVYTNSYHAFAFSIIFERRLILQQDTSGKRTNSRIKTLCKIAGISQKETENHLNFSLYEMSCKSFDIKKLQKAKNDSLNVLAKMIFSE